MRMMPSLVVMAGLTGMLTRGRTTSATLSRTKRPWTGRPMFFWSRSRMVRVPTRSSQAARA